MLDFVDYKILKHLQSKGRMSWAELAEKLKLSPSSTAERVKKLEEQGIIKGYSAVLDYKILGVDILSLIIVVLDKPSNRLEFIRKIKEIEEIEECHHIAGAGDYLLKARCKNIDALEKLVSITIKEIPGIVNTSTTIVLSSVKDEKSLLNPMEK